VRVTDRRGERELMTSGTPGWRPIARGGPLRDRVRSELEQLIIYGVLTPGEHLREEVLAERLQVSRQPVREALQMLARSHFVELRSGRGAFVHAPTRREVGEVFHLRALLEAESARLAARRVDAETLRALAETCTAGFAALDGDTGDDKRELVGLNRRFHQLITDAAGNQVLAETLAGLQLRIDWYLASVIIDRAPASWPQHQDIYEALAARDADRAAALMAEHVDHTRRLLAETSGSAE
jgi:DNA-binding GntR family transcriptional regulator